MFVTIMKLCGIFVSIYSILVILRVMSSWFQWMHSHGRIMQFLVQSTEPYLAFFRRFRIFRAGAIDFSPVLALIILSVSKTIFDSLAELHEITLGHILALFLACIWSAAAFFLGLYIALAVIRILGILIRLNSANLFWRYIDIILNPALLPLAQIVLRGRKVSYLTYLITGCIMLLAIRISGAYIIGYCVLYIPRISF